jgi:hypothetical protein
MMLLMVLCVYDMERVSPTPGPPWRAIKGVTPLDISPKIRYHVLHLFSMPGISNNISPSSTRTFLRVMVRDKGGFCGNRFDNSKTVINAM